MPVYYLNLYDGEFLPDNSGEQFADPAAAREAALRAISELIAEQIVEGRLVDLTQSVEILDDQRRAVDRLVFGDLFTAGAKVLEPQAPQ